MARTSTIRITQSARGTTIRATGSGALELFAALTRAVAAKTIEAPAEPWPSGATVKLRWVGPGRCSGDPGWGLRGPDGEVLSLHSECALDMSVWAIVEERGA